MLRRLLTVGSAAALSGCAGSHSASVPPDEQPQALSPEQQYADDHGLTLDPVAVVREVSPQEQMALVQQCLVDEGWPATLDREGAINTKIPREQEHAYSTSLARCRMQYPIEGRYTKPCGEHEYGLIYDHLIQETLPCLEGLGYSPKKPPSRQTYIEESLVGPSYIVSEGVYDEIMKDVENGRRPSVNHIWTNICPDLPPDAVLYPSP